MTDVAVEVSGLWKKFRRGEIHDSLRDAIPAMARSLMGRGTRRDELGKGDFWALRDVNFEVRRGEALGVIGPNGAGKSTLLKVLSGILRPNRGGIRTNGRLRALIEVGAGFHDDLTGYDNIFLNGAILGMSQREIRTKVDQIIDFAGIEDFIGTPVKRYSSGMRARLGFAIAAHMDPEILLVDEVLSVGDAAFRAKCIDRMQELIRSDVSVIFISHNLEQVQRLCDRCLVLAKGEKVFEGEVLDASDIYMTVLSGVRGDSKDREADSASLVSVSLKDSEGNPVNVIHSRSGVRLEVLFRVERALPLIGVNVGLMKPGHGFVASCRTELDTAGLTVKDAVHSVSLQIEELPLTPGEYWFAVKLRDPVTSEVLDHIDAAAPLVIDGDGDRNFPVLLSHTWEIPSTEGVSGPAGVRA